MSRSAEHRAATRSIDGFTLIEMLVVILIVGFVSTLLFEAVSRIVEVRGRIARHVDTSMTWTLAGEWFKRSTAATVPDFENNPDTFKGSSSAFSGLTLAPFEQEHGAPTRYSWRLNPGGDGLTRLEFSSEGGPWRLAARWSGTTSRFEFAASDGAWQSSWPPSGAAPVARTPAPGMRPFTNPQLPRFIRLSSPTGSEGWTIIVAIDGPIAPRPRQTDIRRALP